MFRGSKIGVLNVAVIIVALSFSDCERKKDPMEIVSKFFKELEFGSSYMAAGEFMIKSPYMSLKDYASRFSNGRPELDILNDWKKSYGREVAEYGYPSLEDEKDKSLSYSLMTSEKFLEMFKQYSFSNFEIKNQEEIGRDRLNVSGYVTVHAKPLVESESLFDGREKFTLSLQNGPRGWKVTFFLLIV